MAMVSKWPCGIWTSVVPGIYWALNRVALSTILASIPITKFLDEAVQELKETDFKDLFKQELEIEKLKRLVPDCNIETDLEILIPEDYVSNISVKVKFLQYARQCSR